MSLLTHLHRNLDQAPGLALNAVAPYAQGVGYLKEGAVHFLNTCDNQLQNTINVVYPILRHPRSSLISAVLFSTRYMSNLTGMACIYQKSCYLLSRRAGRIASVENQLLVKLKKLSNYCEQLNTRYVPWQKIPGLQALEELKEELLNSLDSPDREKIAEAISCCDEVHALVTLHHSISTEDVTQEELHAIEENTDTILSAVEENTGEVLGGYTPSLLAPIFNDLLNSIPESYNPLTLASSSLMATLKKISVTVGSSSILVVTSSNYFVSSNAQKTLLQLSAISGMSAIGLYYQEQVEEAAQEILKTFFEITCAYAGMLLFKTDEPFKDYFHKIVPATAASKATEQHLNSIESSAVVSFALPLLVSSLVYNQASIQESCQQLKRSTINILNGELEKQLLKPVVSFVTDYIITHSSNKLSQTALKETLHRTRFSSIISSSSQLHSSLESIDRSNSSNTPSTASEISNIALNASNSINPSQLISTALEVFIPILYPVINQLLAQPVEQQILRILNISKEYLTILQQDDMQELLLKIQHKLNRLDPEVEELKNQFLRDVFFKKTGRALPLNNLILDLLKKSSGVDMQANLFISFKNAPPVIRMLWNSYSYHKKVDQTLILELLLQGLIINGLADLSPRSNNTEPPSFSYLKTAGLGITLAL
ncbi:hypothetical protein [Candidatus Rhabdochlamydia sp. T3358]|uniref:hypothetical protein n=1 Tax=Candidatus Rhabdochlamydia sp. T3358 TaxID=2099795 RepID=UPI0010BB1C4E|nr:hypothetical protein [Candidatus Rhabdochlamydia sp. T3358]VHO02661.1 hypothetical protein RHT_00597 [Candidatus Rhabdochlamydia sp. T3358]